MELLPSLNSVFKLLQKTVGNREISCFIMNLGYTNKLTPRRNCMKKLLIAFTICIMALVLCSCGESSKEKDCRESVETFLQNGATFASVDPVAKMNNDIYPAILLCFREGEQTVQRVEFDSTGTVTNSEIFDYTVTGESLGSIHFGQYEYVVGAADNNKPQALMRHDTNDVGTEFTGGLYDLLAEEDILA